MFQPDQAPFAIPLTEIAGADQDCPQWPEAVILAGRCEHSHHRIFDGDIGVSIYQTRAIKLDQTAAREWMDGVNWEPDEVAVVLAGQMRHWQTPAEEPFVATAGTGVCIYKGMTGIIEMANGDSLYRELDIHPGTASSHFDKPAGDVVPPPARLPNERLDKAAAQAVIPANDILKGGGDQRYRRVRDDDMRVEVFQTAPVTYRNTQESGLSVDHVRVIQEGELRIQLEDEDNPRIFAEGSYVLVPKKLTGHTEMHSVTGVYRELRISAAC